ncbi:MAG: DEAD/DEAH box helicase [Bdellovibrionaceae bacterium]|nr:DEAD/DEAH box helicase [Pseudobdellovibrionaceae bacterium]
MKFTDLSLSPPLQTAIERMGYSECTPIQEASIPHILEGRDVAGLAQTGTGKTAAFLIPLMERVLRAQPLPETASEAERELKNRRGFPDWRVQNFILVLVPTRELAEQVQENATKLGQDCGLRSVSIYGGTGYDRQKEALRSGVTFVAATPGRLIDLYKDHQVDLKQVRAVVFDEADRMFDMGFKDDMRFILQRIPRGRQFLVFSATLNLDVLNTAYQFGANPIEVNVSRDQAKAENVRDQIFHLGQDEKPQHLLSLIRLHQPRQVIVFTNFKTNVERISRFLNENGLQSSAISSLLTQAQRNRVLELFKDTNNNMNILVATDVAARGLDIKGVDMVVNYELPQDAETYVHRIGRTGRAGAEGKAFSLVSDRDVESLMRIEDYLKHKLEVGFLENDQLVTDFKPMAAESASSERFGDRAGAHFREGGRRRDEARDGHRSKAFVGRQGHPRQREQRGEARGPRSQRQEYKNGRARFHQDQQQTRGTRQEQQRSHRHTARRAHTHQRAAQTPATVQKNQASISLTKRVANFFKRLFG